MSKDLIEDKPQPLIEHLIELRQRLIWAVVAFFEEGRKNEEGRDGGHICNL